MKHLGKLFGPLACEVVIMKHPSPALRVLLCSLLTSPLLAGCQGGAVAPDAGQKIYMLRLPPGYAQAGQMDSLKGELSRRGLALRHEYGDAVGLRGTVSVRGTAAQVQALLAESGLPIEAHAAVYRYPLDMPPECGSGTCAPDEAATMNRSTTCSIDCGVPPRQDLQDELTNAWHVTKVNADKAWALGTRGQGVHVGILDTGYDHGPASTHPDRPDHLSDGYNFVSETPDFSAVGDHGTHVAGIIAAPLNGYGTVGIAPEAIIHPYQIFSGNGGSLGAADADIVAAVEMAIQSNVNILNLSLGGPSDSELEHEAMRKAYDAGLLVVVAAGNSENYAMGNVLTAPHQFPGAYPESMSIGATDRNDQIAGFSSEGHTVVVSAPGVNVYSSVPVGHGDAYTVATVSIGGQAKPLPILAQIPTGGSFTPLKDAPLASCGYGAVADITACAPKDKVALVRRGPPSGMGTPIPFADKIANARAGGALGVIIYNHRSDPSSNGGQFGASIGMAVPVPVYTLAAGDGEFLAYQLGQGHPITLSASSTTGDFANYSGTSMATPATVGVAALVWAKYPQLTNVQLRQLLAESAVDLGAPGRDDAFGWGRVDALRALTQAAPLARCGDGRLDRASEICDSTVVGTQTCDDFGWDTVPGTGLRCNDRCTAVDPSHCACLPSRGKFTTSMTVTQNVSEGGMRGTLAVYNVKLNGQPVRGALVNVSVTLNGAPAYTYQLGPSDDMGNIQDFTPYDGTGMSAGNYVFTPVITKGQARCHDDAPIMTPGPNYTVKINS